MSKTENIFKRLQEYDKKAKVVKLFNPNESRTEFGCPPRLCLNTYVGCRSQCAYCYNHYIKGFDSPHEKYSFENYIRKDIKRIFEFELQDLVVSISNSTDPLQEPLESRHGHTLFALHELNKHGLKVLILTKNPSMLLNSEYFEQINNENVALQVSIAFINNRFEPGAPLVEDRLKAVAELKKKGLKNLAIRLDPLVSPEIGGQTDQELEELIKRIKDVGVDHVISKVFRLVGAIGRRYKLFFEEAKRHYVKVGAKWNKNHYMLQIEKKKQLLERVWGICQREGLTLSVCYEKVVFPGVFKCDLTENKLGVCWRQNN